MLCSCSVFGSAFVEKMLEIVYYVCNFVCCILYYAHFVKLEYNTLPLI